LPSLIDELLQQIQGMDEASKANAKREIAERTKNLVWVPSDGPQKQAYLCEADELLYGGSAGSGKSDLLVGLALTAHKRSLILRRFNDDARRLADRAVEILGHSDGLNRTLMEWRLKDKFIAFGGCQLESDKHRYKGSPFDLLGIDEGADFLKSQFEFIKIWNRSADPKQRCRIVIATNPPTTAEGQWLTERWAAWLDSKHPNPAKSGEIRWYAQADDDREIEVDGPGPHLVRGAMTRATSRTFIRGNLEDNPDYARSGYKDRLQLLPEELRNIYSGGDFSIGMRDQPNQVIPTAWIEAAQKRWTKNPPQNVPMVAIGVDCSGGGSDPMIIAPRYDYWFAPLIEIPGKQLPMDRLGKFGAAAILTERRNKALVILDMGGGYGQSIYENLKENEIEVFKYNGNEATGMRTRDRIYGFYNVRSHAIWSFREALDPDQDQGSPIALPPDQVLMADLTTPTFEVGPRGIKVETKENIVKRLGRSPDCLIAGTMVSTPTGDVPIELLVEGDAVVTPYGTRRIVCVHRQYCDNVVELQRGGKVLLAGKPSHRVFTWEDGWVRLDRVTDTHTLERFTIWNLLAWRLQNLLFTKGSATGFKRLVDTINRTTPLTRSDFFTAASGAIITGRSQMACISTTLMETGLTIGWRIWNRLTAASIAASTWLSECRARNTDWPFSTTWLRGGKRQHRGIHRQKGLSGIESTVAHVGKAASAFVRTVSHAAMYLTPQWKEPAFAQRHVSSVPTRPRSELCPPCASAAGQTSWPTSISPRPAVQSPAPTSSECAIVYDLTLDQDNAYYANGVLVENCGDAVIMSYYAGASSLRGMDIKPRNRPVEVVTKRGTRSSGSQVVITKRMRRR